MLTPRFELGQDDEFVRVEMRVPGHVRLGEDDLWVEGRCVKFHAAPYFLALELPGDVVQDGRERAEFDRASDRLTLWLPKRCRGERFDGLDMLTQLVLRRPAAAGSPKPHHQIEVVGVGGESSTLAEPLEDVAACAAAEELGVGRPAFGFNGMRDAAFFEPLMEDLPEIVDFSAPEVLLLHAKERRAAREKQEDAKFDAEHYMADFSQAESVVAPLLAFRPRWALEEARIATLSPADLSAGTTEGVVELLPEHNEAMLSLPRKEYIIVDENSVISALVSIVYAFAFEHRETLGEPNVESAWTLCKLSPALSWLDAPQSPHDALIACMHRALAYPLHRHFDLALQAAADTACIFRLGRRAVLRALLDARAILAAHEHRHYLNALYVDDCAVWVQSLQPERFSAVAAALGHASLSKADIRWPLEELEELAAEHVEDEATTDDSERPAML